MVTTMGVRLLIRPAPISAPALPGTGFTVLLLAAEGDEPKPIRSFSSLTSAMELAGVRWYETNGERPYDVWVRSEETGRLHFAPRLRIRLEHGAHDAETLRLGALLERAPLP